MTIRQAIKKITKDQYIINLASLIPNNYSIKQAEQKGIIDESDGYFLATFISLNWEKLYNR